MVLVSCSLDMITVIIGIVTNFIISSLLNVLNADSGPPVEGDMDTTMCIVIWVLTPEESYTALFLLTLCPNGRTVNSILFLKIVAMIFLTFDTQTPTSDNSSLFNHYLFLA